MTATCARRAASRPGSSWVGGWCAASSARMPRRTWPVSSSTSRAARSGSVRRKPRRADRRRRGPVAEGNNPLARAVRLRMNLLGWIHVIAAGAAIASGAVVLFLRKGNRRHRRLGWIYATSMAVLNISALMIYRLFGGFGPFHAFAIVSLVTVGLGVATAVRR